jgi:hypothetical protein
MDEDSAQAQEEPMNTWNRRAPVSVSAVIVLVVMAIVLSATGHGSQIVALTVGVLLFVRFLARSYADEVLVSDYPRHGDNMD